MRRLVPVLALGLLLAGCASPGAKLQNAVADLTDAANSGSATGTADAARTLLALIDDQRRSGELDSVVATRMTGEARAILANAKKVDGPAAPSPSPTPSPSASSAPPTLPPPPVETSAAPRPTEQPTTAPPTPSPTPTRGRRSPRPTPSPTPSPTDPVPTQLDPTPVDQSAPPSASPAAANLDEDPYAGPTGDSGPA